MASEAFTTAMLPNSVTPKLISAPDARLLLGRARGTHLPSLAGFPEPAGYGPEARNGKPLVLYRQSEVEQWKVDYELKKSAKRKSSEQQESRQRAREAAAARNIAWVRGLIGLPKEFDVVRSLRRDLFDENPRTFAPKPCSHWLALLSDGGEAVDGRDVSPKTLAAEAARDRADVARSRPGLSIGHRPDVVRPRPSNPSFSASTKIVPPRVDYPLTEAVQVGSLGR